MSLPASITTTMPPGDPDHQRHTQQVVRTVDKVRRELLLAHPRAHPFGGPMYDSALSRGVANHCATHGIPLGHGDLSKLLVHHLTKKVARSEMAASGTRTDFSDTKTDFPFWSAC